MSILTTADKFRYEVEKLVSAEVDRIKENLSLGFVEDYAQYKFVAGKITGLRQVFDLLDEAEANCNK